MAIGLIEVAEGEHMAPLTRADAVNALIADCRTATLTVRWAADRIPSPDELQSSADASRETGEAGAGR